MPKAAISDREKQICRRVRVARELRRKTQQACAELTGIERSTLANYEAEITPVSYDQAKRICYRLNINQVWLATGASPFAPYFDISPNLEFSIKQNTLFSEAFDSVLKDPIQDQINALVKWIGVKAYFAGQYDDAVLDNLHLAGAAPGKAAGFYVENVISMKFHWMPESFRPEFANALLNAEKQFYKQYGDAIERQIRERQARDVVDPLRLNKVKNFLTETETSEILTPVNHPFKKLLADLKEATSAPGQMSALAEYLGEKTGANVPLASVSRWLNGKREPGGEITLWMREWVTDPKRKK